MKHDNRGNNFGHYSITSQFILKIFSHFQSRQHHISPGYFFPGVQTAYRMFRLWHITNASYLCHQSQQCPQIHEYIVNRYKSRSRRNSLAIGATGVGSVRYDTGHGRAGQAIFHHDLRSFGGDAGLQSFSYLRFKDVKDRLASAGLAGLASYGLFNTLYYCIALILCWPAMAPPERGQGLTRAATVILKTFAVIWTGSQITKLPRAICALLCTPLMDAGMTLVQRVLGLKSKKTVREGSHCACMCTVYICAYCR